MPLRGSSAPAERKNRPGAGGASAASGRPGPDGTTTTRSGSSAQRSVATSAVARDTATTRPARRASRDGDAARCHARSYAVKSPGRSSHERSWTVSANGTPAPSESGAGAGAHTTSTSPPKRRSSRGRVVRVPIPCSRRLGSRWRSNPRAGPLDRARQRRGTPAGHEHAPLVIRERRRQRGHQRARIVRDPAAPPTGEAPTIDPDSHAP